MRIRLGYRLNFSFPAPTPMIVMLNVPPDAAGDCDVDETVYAHDWLGVVGVLFLLHAAAPSAAISAHAKIGFIMQLDLPIRCQRQRLACLIPVS